MSIPNDWPGLFTVWRRRAMRGLRAPSGRMALPEDWPGLLMLWRRGKLREPAVPAVVVQSLVARAVPIAVAAETVSANGNHHAAF